MSYPFEMFGPQRHDVHPDDVEQMKKFFAPGGKFAGKPYFDDDWFRYFPNMTYEVHELCLGCEPDGTCPFHPPGCECSYGVCQEVDTDWQEISGPRAQPRFSFSPVHKHRTAPTAVDNPARRYWKRCYSDARRWVSQGAYPREFTNGVAMALEVVKSR